MYPKSLTEAFLILSFFLNFGHAFGQHSGFVAGEYIVRVQADIAVSAFIEKYNLTAQKRSNDLSYTKIMSEPFNIWLFKSTGSILERQRFENLLKSERDFIHVSPNRTITQRKIPDDPDFIKQWQYINTGSTGGVPGADMDMDLAWDITTGGVTPSGDTIVICVIDDGINADHEDLKDNLWVNHHEIPGNDIDDDGNGYVDDFKGWNVLKGGSDDVYSGGGHGTPVAGIIGARGNNKKGVAGVNWNVKLMIVNFQQATEANALASYAYAYTMRKLYNNTQGAKGAFIVATNASWGIDNKMAEEAPLWCALYDELGKVGILNCGATTNNNTDVDARGDLPTSCPSEYLIAVSNINKSDQKVSSAGFGRKSVDIGAYGEGVYTLTRTGYGNFGGTSGATPHVTGVIGLLYSAPCTQFQNLVKSDPAKAALVAKDMILNGVVDNPSLKDITTTGGKLNALRALTNVISLCGPCSTPAGITLSAMDRNITVNWITETGNNNVSMRYRKADASSWIVINGLQKGYVIESLDFCTEYEIQIGSTCESAAGKFNFSRFVTTAGCCKNPEISDIISSDSTLSFNILSAEPADYLIQYKQKDTVWQDTLIAESAFLLSHLPPCTSYTLKIKALCTKYGVSSDFTNEFALNSACGNCTENKYCTFGWKDASQEWISSFSIAGIENISGSSQHGYSNFAGVNRIDLSPGEIYEFNITAQYAGSAYPDYYKIFIDYNQNGSWEEEEKVYASLTPLQFVSKGTIAIPGEARAGYTRLRVILSYESFSGACDSDEFEYGEIEDYCVFINESKCVKNIFVASSAVSRTEIKFKVQYAEDTKDTLQIAIRQRGTFEWKYTTGVDSIVINSLNECTLYEYRYLVKCDGKWSSPSPLDTLRTLCSNNTNEIAEEILLFPNPASATLSVLTNVSGISVEKIDILDLSGMKILKAEINDKDKMSAVDISVLPSGLYLAVITLKGGKRIINKLIKSNY